MRLGPFGLLVTLARGLIAAPPAVGAQDRQSPLGLTIPPSVFARADKIIE
ncbi:MAG: hypothetical protein HYU25_06160 [Candidatus Rokubacteria bacterium]|nr:hypothetical protein [Candidatus Rokubacteria bacterium]